MSLKSKRLYEDFSLPTSQKSFQSLQLLFTSFVVDFLEKLLFVDPTDYWMSPKRIQSNLKSDFTKVCPSQYHYDVHNFNCPSLFREIILLSTFIKVEHVRRYVYLFQTMVFSDIRGQVLPSMTNAWPYYRIEYIYF